MFQTSDILKKRVYALTTDLFIVVLSNYFLMASLTNFLRTVFFHFPLHTQLFLIHKMAIMSSTSLLLLTFSYFSIFYYVTNGRTMGKTLFGLKVVSPDGDISLKQSIQRSFAYIIAAMLGSFLLTLSFIRKDDKSLADILSSTMVAYDLKDKNITENLESGTVFQLTLIEAINNSEKDADPIEYFEQNKAA